MSRTGPRRSESIRVAVLNAADDLLVEQGFAATTIEGIAARAGVAKQTIYRWWKSKVEILLDALTDDALEGLAWAEPAGTASEDLTAHLHRVADFFQEPAGQVLQALLGHAQLDKEAATALREAFLLKQRERDLAGLGAVLERHTGRTPDAETLGRLTDLLLGPLYYRVLVFGQPADEQLIESAVDLALKLAD
ncbi:MULTISPECIES: TetR/AcrR family transcriptional regulator [Streptomyces]|uniref:TetR/AcrR family transcriptional regulator n=1 Tax=Streptomyces TaxID=1883 RepID=UPI00207A4EEA|nr:MULTISPECIES: TetR/AcrR family transcriptional regulator [Streptomyces]MCM9080938.1 TetR/AcrR family transcriptional regulator [Streptomyces spororaveus]MCX5304615.1 TetR/AcrR family transcriptional regulator [Streptomyces sp. NBC_00160]